MDAQAELRSVIDRLYAGITGSDPDLALGTLARRPDALMIGTDAGEWWAGYDSISQALAAQTREMSEASAVTFRGGDYDVQMQGDVAWIADRPSFVLPDGSEVPLRLTAVFLKEAEQWKLVQGHLSIGVPNAEALGTELTI